MKFIKRFLFGLLVLILAAILGLYISGNKHVLTAVSNTYLKGTTGPSIDEHTIFPNRSIDPVQGADWPAGEMKALTEEQKAYHEKYESVAFLVIHKGNVIAEHYWEDYDEERISNSFSMSKSIIGLLTGIAIDEGKIQSLNDLTSDYIPELKGTDKENISLYHLISMSSGIDWGESYTDPFGFQAKTYYGEDLFETCITFPAVKKPGTEHLYQGGNTLILAKVVENAVGMPVSDYAEKMVWQKIEATESALWNLDEEKGFEKASCCYYATARDFARFGQLYLCQGNWKGEQIVSSAWVDESIKPVNIPNPDGTMATNYGYQWWLSNYQGMDNYSMRGMQGQYVIAIPDKEVVIVRLGRNRPDKLENKERLDFVKYVEMALELIEN
ncbi:MAG: serine hydrolase [Bacteroidota bacterium]